MAFLDNAAFIRGCKDEPSRFGIAVFILVVLAKLLTRYFAIVSAAATRTATGESSSAAQRVKKSSKRVILSVTTVG
jgi:hypothetical protein